MTVMWRTVNDCYVGGLSDDYRQMEDCQMTIVR